MLIYKAKWYGREVIKMSRFEPTSKRCSCCGDINNDLTLKIREWLCLICGAEHDRDVNAAINILQTGSGRAKEGVELSTLVGAKKHQLYALASI